jgi:hypothetical protein
MEKEMPTLESELILTPEKKGIQVAIEPAVNALGSLIFLSRVDDYSGLDPWVVKTSESLDQELLQANLVVMQGLFYAWEPDRSWPSFMSLVDHLEATDPLVLRDRVLDTYTELPCKKGTGTEVDPISKEALLSDFATFIAYLRSKFGEEHVDETIEKEAYGLLSNPKKMRSYIVSHFRTMWTEVLEAEWERTYPLIDESAVAFQKVDLSQMTKTLFLSLHCRRHNMDLVQRTPTGGIAQKHFCTQPFRIACPPLSTCRRNSPEHPRHH